MNLVVFFRNLKAIHLSKDIGTLPLYHQRLGFGKSFLVGGAEEFDPGDYSNTIPVKNFNLSGNNLINWIKLLWHLNQRKDAALVLFHLCPSTYILVFFLYLLGRRDVLVKLDMNIISAISLVEQQKAKGMKPRRLIRSIGLRLVSYFIIETREVSNILSQIPEMKGKLRLIRNGGFEQDGHSQCHVKKNIITFAGRLGSIPKNAESIINAVRRLDSLKDWQIYFAGPIEDEKFNDFYNEFKSDRKDISSNVVLTGNLSKNDLYELLKVSRYYIAPSLWEGSSIALAEAAGHGAIIVSTDVGVMADFRNTEMSETLICGFTEFYTKLIRSRMDRSIPTDAEIKNKYSISGLEEHLIQRLSLIITDIVSNELPGRPFLQNEVLALSHEQVGRELDELTRLLND